MCESVDAGSMTCIPSPANSSAHPPKAWGSPEEGSAEVETIYIVAQIEPKSEVQTLKSRKSGFAMRKNARSRVKYQKKTIYRINKKLFKGINKKLIT